MKIQKIKDFVRDHEAERISESDITRASILIPLVERGSVTQILFEERNANIAQGGEICFPGGHVEAGESPAETAVRETCEELSLDRNQVELVAPLHLLSANGARRIDSFLGVLHGYADTWENSEVARTFLIPLDWFVHNPPEIYEGKTTVAVGDDFPFDLIPGGKDYHFIAGIQRFYFYRTQHGVIWGLTAKLLFHFMKLLEIFPDRA